MARITIPLVALEFDEGGDTLWFQGIGGTVFRLKTTGGIHTRTCVPNDAPPASQAPAVSHGDLLVNEPVEICLGNDKDVELSLEFPLADQIRAWMRGPEGPRDRQRRPGEKEFDIVESGGEYVMSGTWCSLAVADPRYVELHDDVLATMRRNGGLVESLSIRDMVPTDRKVLVMLRCACGWEKPLKNSSAMVELRAHRCERVHLHETTRRSG